ncbi:type I Zorya anti-phage system protein ZorA1 [Tolumonas osonensis]|uniref:DNA anti-recombination protein RmuC n=1 Tax=Tolumonas osonensis TaxID=675874 RepID=A0A841GLJ4_9GAMM|nr:type I Zorya anti-phage system protein ZorA1 [Tolumonas osonensis]MBB6055362.1 DNA anti-recombination protein RmuC [Tolumonas osonensis]
MDITLISEPLNLFINTLVAVKPFIVPVSVISIVTLLLLLFLFRYFSKSFVIVHRLKRLTDRLKEIKKLQVSEQIQQLETVFNAHALEHAWSEYSETLHKQYQTVEGERELQQVRSTATSAAFFTQQYVVDTPLGTEFYKHLPGILTGVGIIGTFFGLMIGLHHFDPSSPEQVASSVDALLKDVLYAFLGSFAAIFVSILVTFLEKYRLAVSYKQLEKLTEALDSFFDSGVGEEYLAELVKASNESATQARQLKDGLVSDLREMLQNLVDSQVRENLKLAETLSSTYQQSGQMMADQVSGAIQNSLKSPLEAIAGAVQTASGDQSGQVQTLLQDVLTAFMSKLDTTFGQQFSGLHEMMGKSVMAMESMQSGFATLLQDIRAASDHSTQSSNDMVSKLLADMQAGQNAMQAGMNDLLSKLHDSISKIGEQGEDAGLRMANQLEKMFAENEAKQQAMAVSLDAFVESIKASVGSGQQEMMEKVASTVDILGQRLDSVFQQLENGQQQLDQASRTSQAELHQGTRELVKGLDEQVKVLLDAVSSQQASTQSTIEALGKQTAINLREMQSGAEKMKDAADRFVVAGSSVTGATESAAKMFGEMQGLNREIVVAANELSSIVSDYRNNRETIGKTVSLLEGLIANTQTEMAHRTQFLNDIKQHSERLQTYNREVREYLEHISSVLGKGFNEFTESVDKSLRKTLGSLDVELDKAVTSLAGGVENVRESIEDLSDVLSAARK